MENKFEDLYFYILINPLNLNHFCEGIEIDKDVIVAKNIDQVTDYYVKIFKREGAIYLNFDIEKTKNDIIYFMSGYGREIITEVATIDYNKDSTMYRFLVSKVPMCDIINDAGDNILKKYCDDILNDIYLKWFDETFGE